MKLHINDETWDQWYADRLITGDPAKLPQYFYTSTTTTTDKERSNAVNVVLRGLSERSLAQQPQPENPPGTTPGMYEISGTIELAPGAP